MYLQLTLAAQKWNDELATIAQNYANRCIWAHNPSRISKTFSYVGENIYTTTGIVSDYRSVVQSWYNEVANYHYSSNTCDPGKVCGHYTQVSRQLSPGPADRFYHVPMGVCMPPEIN